MFSIFVTPAPPGANPAVFDQYSVYESARDTGAQSMVTMPSPGVAFTVPGGAGTGATGIAPISVDNALSPSAQRGHDFYVGTRLSDGVPGFGFTCAGCHELDPAQGYFGTGTKQSFENEPQIMKVPQLRNAYAKVGMFGMIQASFFEPQDSSPQGPQIRGFGFLHDGSTDTLFRFFHATVFAPNANAGFDGGDAQRRDVEAFVMSFDADLAPIVGQQATLRADNATKVGPRIDLLIARAKAPFVSKVLGGSTTECDLTAKVRVDGRNRGYVMTPTGEFAPDDGSATLSDADLRALASVPGQEVTYTAVPPGSGQRVGVDRDLDGVLDGAVEAPSDDGGGCGCQSADGPSGGAALLFALARLRPKRRVRRR